MSLSDFEATHSERMLPSWAKSSRTKLAHGSGRLPTKTATIGWQPIAGAGPPPVVPLLSKSMNGLRRRIVRGEA